MTKIKFQTCYRYGELSVIITIVNPEKLPYKESELFGIKSYRIEDMSGKSVVKDCASDMVSMSREQMIIKLPLENLENGTYKLVIEEFVSEKKADQPLIISGNWECGFEF